MFLIFRNIQDALAYVFFCSFVFKKRNFYFRIPDFLTYEIKRIIAPLDR